MSDKDSFLNRKGTGLSLSGRRKTDPVGLKKQLIVSYRLEIKDVAAWLKARFPENENEINAMAEVCIRSRVVETRSLIAFLAGQSFSCHAARELVRRMKSCVKHVNRHANFATQDELDDIYKMRKEDENQYDPLDGF